MSQDAPRPTGPRRDGAPAGRRRRRRPDAARIPDPPPLSPAAAGTPPGQALERLRARVLDTVREIERLRAENESLAARLAEVDADAAQGPAMLPAGTDPEALRLQIEGFVEALDALLADADAPAIAS